MGILIKDQRVLYAFENIGHINTIIDPTQPQSISINPSAPTLAAMAGATVQLDATVLPQTAIDKSVTWSSSDTSVATVNNNGLVTRTAPLTSDNGQPHSVTITATAVNGVMGSVTLQAAVLQLPAGAFAVFDGIVGARNKIAEQWQDMSCNGRDLQIVDGNAEPNYWNNEYPDCLHCDCNNHSTSALFNTDSFVPGNGFTVSALVDYDETATDFQHGDYTTGNGLDIIFGVHSSTRSVQMGVGARNTNNRQLFIAHRENTSDGYTRHFTTKANLTGVRLITWVIEGDNRATQCKVYIDGVLFETVNDVDNVVYGISPVDLSFFAATAVAQTVSNVYNFFGQVYGLTIYNRELTANELAQLKSYYLERYSNYYTAQ